MERKEKRRNYTGGEKSLPTLIKEKEPLWYCKIPPLKEKDQWGSGGLQAWPEPSPDESAGKGTSEMDKFSSVNLTE